MLNSTQPTAFVVFLYGSPQNFKNKLTVFLWSVLIFSGCIQIAEATNTKIEEEVVVTALRTPQQILQSLRPVSVLNKETIERSHATNLIELIKNLPAVQTARTGGIGGLNSLFLRGNQSDHVLVLIDGVRVSNINAGNTPWNEIPIDQIERVEVIRGPKGALYGSEAIGGIIQIFTHNYLNNDRAQSTSKFSMSYGSRETVRTNLQYSYNDDQQSFAVGAAFYETQGISHRDSGGLNDDDDARSTNAKLSYRRKINSLDEGEFRFNYLYTKSEYEFDAFSPNANLVPEDIYEDSRLNNISLNFQHKPQYSWLSSLEFGYSRNVRVSYDPTPGSFSGPVSPYNSKHRHLRWQNTVEINVDNTIVVGAEYYEDEAQPPTRLADDDRDNTATFLEYIYSGRIMQWVVTTRIDDNEQYGSYQTNALDVGVNLIRPLQLVLSYGESFKAPTFDDLYGFGGNLELEPEEANNAEIGLRFRQDNYQLNVNIFRNDVESLISVQCDASFTCKAININAVRIEGVETEYNHSFFNNTQLNLSYVWLSPKDRNDDSILLRRARREFKAQLNHSYGSNQQWHLGVDWIARSKRYDFGGVRLGGYGFVNLRLGYQTRSQWRIQASIENFNDKHYRHAAGYNTEGVTALISFEWNSSQNQ